MDSNRKRGFSVTPERLAFVEQKMGEWGIESREALAERADLSIDVINKLFTGGNVDRSTIEAIARKALKVEPVEIIEPERWYRKPKAKKAQAAISIDWKQVCQDMLELRWKMVLTSHPLGAARRVEDVYIPLELVERQSKPRLEQDLNPEKFSVRQQEEKTTPVTHQEFFDCVLKGQSPKSKGRRIAIIGEPGAGKTTLLQEISTKVDGIPIWIDLASLGRGDTLEEYLLHNWLKSSLSIIRRYALEAVPNVLEPTTELKQAFTELFEQEQVWLLLDGADELSAELGQPLNWVAQQLQQSGWIAKAKVVLTSRLNLWSDYGDRLGEFDTYRNLDFEPKQVTEFIDKWFAEKPEDRNKLKEDLEESGDRIKSLVRNPLRLTLLCLTWKGVGDRLPDTKAGLYQRLVRSHYEHQWKTKPEDFAQFEDEEEQDKLNQWLGELSKTALDGKDSHFQGSRFRFRKSALTYFAKQFERGNDLLKWSIKLGWLNQIGLPSADEADADEPIYAFLHPTFQEYFAALAIDDWHYFLSHFPSNPDKGIYRIFNQYWREIFLLWFGQASTQLTDKEDVIVSLVSFADSCEDFYEGFYYYRAYFLAASALGELCNSSVLANRVISQVIELYFGYIDFEGKRWSAFPVLFEDEAKLALQETNRGKVVEILTDLLRSIRINRSLGTTLNEDLILTKLIKLISSTNIERGILKLSKLLLELDPINQEAINALTDLLNCHHMVREAAALILSKADPGNLKAENIQNETSEKVKEVAGTIFQAVFQAVESINSRISKAYQVISLMSTISLVEKLHESYKHDDLLFILIIERLGEIGFGDIEAIIVLIFYLFKSDDPFVCQQIYLSLKKIITGEFFSSIIKILKHYLVSSKQTVNFSAFEYCLYLLWYCTQGMSYPEFYRVWHSLSCITDTELLTE